MKRLLGIGQVCALAAVIGCGTVGDDYVYQNEPERRAYNQEMIKSFENEQVVNGVITQQTIYPHQFHAQSPSLTELGERDLLMLADHFKEHVLPNLGETNVLREVKVYFDYDKSFVRPNEFDVLNQGIELLQSNPDASIVITGRADARGSYEYNAELAERRARAVEQYLADQGVDPNRVKVISRADLDAQAPVTDEQAMQLDRHAMFKVTELRDYPVSLNVRRGGVPEQLYDLRTRSVRSFLSEQGIDTNLISIADGMSRGPGIPSEQGALFLISTYASERENTPTKKTISGRQQAQQQP